MMNPVLRTIAACVGIGIIMLGLWYFSTIIFYILAAGIISLIGRPIFHLLKKLSVRGFKLPNAVCAIITLLLFYAIIAAIGALFIPLVIKEAALLSSIDYNQVSYNFQNYLREFNAFFGTYSNTPQDFINIDFIKQQLAKFIDFTNLSMILNSVFNVMGNILAAVFAITFIAYFFLSDQSLFFRILLLAFPREMEPKATEVLHKVIQLLSRYFTGLIIENSLLTFIVSMGLYIAGIENAMLIGFFVGMMNVIPYVGPIISLAFGLIVAITTTLDSSVLEYSMITPLILKVASIIFITQIIDNVILQPFIFSKSVKAHPLEIFLIILMAGTLAGIPGMILAVPVYTILRVVAKEFLSEFDVIKKLTREI